MCPLHPGVLCYTPGSILINGDELFDFVLRHVLDSWETPGYEARLELQAWMRATSSINQIRLQCGMQAELGNKRTHQLDVCVSDILRLPCASAGGASCCI
jgi:hypothetical protein